MKLVNYIFLLLLPFVSVHEKSHGPAEGFCGIANTTTQSGEEISYTVYYSFAGMYVNAGEATFSNQLEKLNGHTVFHVKGSGQSSPGYDWIYKVRDLYESYIDTSTMQPLKFARDVLEGKNRKTEHMVFNRSNNTVKSDSVTYKTPPCIQDVLSAVYYSRNIDFNAYKVNETIPFTMFLEGQSHQLYIRYLGKEKVRTKMGRFRAIKFKPLLVEGTIFEGGEKMTVWVSDDNARVPLRIESQILIGSVKVDMTDYKNLRHPLSGLMRK